MHKLAAAMPALLLLLLLTGCSSMRYDLESVAFPLQANPDADVGGEPFELKSKYVMYVHGLLGEKQPNVAALLNEEFGGAKAVVDFRVAASTSIWDWLGTHLSLGFVRLKTVYIRGKVVR